jgi:glutathione S-transferase
VHSGFAIEEDTEHNETNEDTMTRSTVSTPTPARLHRHPLSGHSHRVELFLSLLGVPCELVHVDLTKAEHKSAAFLEKNLFGQVPVLEDGDVVVADSNAILVYLALKHDREGRWLPRDPVGAAAVQRWFSVAAGQLAFGPAAARLINVFKAPFRADEVKARAHALFTVIEKHLTGRSFLLGTDASVADVALYAYVARAPEGGVSLVDYPLLRGWLARIEALPHFVPMTIA